MTSNRRTVLKGITGLAGLSLLPIPSALANPNASARVFILSDLHSAYETYATTVGMISREIAGNSAIPTLIVINGDVFERGNVLALRSAGSPDWLILERLAALAPTVLNLGNHETALVDDMAMVVSRARAAGIAVVSNMIDKRTGAAYAEPAISLSSRGRTFRVVGICTDELMTYRQPVRPALELPEPGKWARAQLPELLRDADIPVVLSHAGVMADREFIDVLPPGTLLVGGHEHLTFQHSTAALRYIHLGAWGRGYALASFGDRRSPPEVGLVSSPVDAPADNALREAVDAVRAAHLTDQDKAIVGHLASGLALPDAARFLTLTMARAANAHVGIISHTTLGTGIPSGKVTELDLAAFIRFDGSLFTTEVDGSTLASLLAVANQDREMPLGQRRGDFIYMNHEAIGPNNHYRIVTNGWPQLKPNQQRYFGRSDLTFAEIPELKLRAVFKKALPA